MELNQFHMFDALFEGVYALDKQSRIVFWNKGAERITGFSSNETVGRYCYDNLLNHIDVQGRQLYLGAFSYELTLNEGTVQEGEAYIQHRMGYRIPVKIRIMPWIVNDEIVGIIEMFIENNESKHAIKRIGSISNKLLRDKLTGLPNRSRFEHYVSEKIRDFEKLSIPFGIAIVDIDNFESVNDIYGRDLGDEMLKLLTETFKHSIKLAEMIGRWQNDAFVFVFTDVNTDSLYLLCEKIRVLSEGSVLRTSNVRDVDFSVSVGGAVYRGEDTVDTLIERAGLRLKKAKTRGGNNCVTK